SKRDNRAVVHGVVKRRTSQHKPVYKSYGYACGSSSFKLPQHSAGCRAMQIQLVTIATIEGWDHERLAVHVEPHVGQECGIQDRVNFLQVVRAALRQPPKHGSLSPPHGFSREKVAIQFVSQVLPPSMENACSHRGASGEAIHM